MVLFTFILLTGKYSPRHEFFANHAVGQIQRFD